LALAWLCLVGTPSVQAQGAGDPEREYCFCTTPHNQMNASGTDDDMNQSACRIFWRGVWYEHQPMAGDTAEDVMTGLRAMISAANPADTFGPIVVDPATGRALFCIRGLVKGMGKVTANTTDVNFSGTTFQRLQSEKNWFLRRAGGAFIGQASGTDVTVVIKVLKDALETLFQVVIPTVGALVDPNQDVVDALKALGFDAEVEKVEIAPGVFVDGFGIISAPPGTGSIEEVGLASNDPGLRDLTVFAYEDVLHINEVDADQVATDAMEYLELQGTGGLDLTNYFLVFYNGNGDTEYFVIDLAGSQIPADEYFVVGVPTVPNVDLTPAGFPLTNAIQNGADGIALWYDPTGLLDVNDFLLTTVDTPPADAQLVDAIVYGTSDADDLELLAALTPGQVQVDENANGAKDIESSQRCPDFGVPFASHTYMQAPPTPGTANVCWSDQGCALPGVFGDPLLVGTGPLSAGSLNSADLSNCAPLATAGLFLALASTPIPFKGGTIKPFPFFEPIFLPTSPLGEISIPFVMPAGIPPGTELWVQWGIQDGAAVAGVALSNAILGVTP